MTTQTSAIPTQSTQSKPLAYGMLSLAVVVTSWAPILIRLSQDAGVPSLLIAVSRVGLAALFLTPAIVFHYRKELRNLSRSDLLLAVVSGIFLIIHFVFFVTSLSYTSVLIAVMLVNSSPIWIPILEALFLKTVPGRVVLLGLTMATIGALIITLAGAGGAVDLGSKPLLGGTFALIGAIALSFYMVIGRKVRAKISLLPYVWLVYGCAAIPGIGLLFITQTPVTGYPAQGYLWMLLLTLGPQLTGHTLYNYSLRFFTATYVGLATQMLVIITSIWAALLFGEIPSLVQIFGGVLIVTGVLLPTFRPEPTH